MNNKPSMSMTPEEVCQFLQSQSHAAACTLSSDGKLIAHVVNYEMKDEGSSLLLKGSIKDLQDGPICIVADDCPSYYEIKGALIQGRLTRTDDGGTVDITGSSGFDFSKVGKPDRKEKV